MEYGLKRKRPPTEAASLLQIRRGVLFELGRDARKLGVQLGAKAIDDRNDRDGNPGGDQSVFNGGSARLILQKRNKLKHWLAPLLGWADENRMIQPLKVGIPDPQFPGGDYIRDINRNL